MMTERLKNNDLLLNNADNISGRNTVCLDTQPYATTQAPEREDILNIGGFSDAVFTLIEQFARGKMQAGHWVGVIESQQLVTT